MHSRNNEPLIAALFPCRLQLPTIIHLHYNISTLQLWLPAVFFWTNVALPRCVTHWYDCVSSVVDVPSRDTWLTKQIGLRLERCALNCYLSEYSPNIQLVLYRDSLLLHIDIEISSPYDRFVSRAVVWPTRFTQLPRKWVERVMQLNRSQRANGEVSIFLSPNTRD